MIEIKNLFKSYGEKGILSDVTFKKVLLVMV